MLSRAWELIKVSLSLLSLSDAHSPTLAFFGVAFRCLDGDINALHLH